MSEGTTAFVRVAEESSGDIILENEKSNLAFGLKLDICSIGQAKPRVITCSQLCDAIVKRISALTCRKTGIHAAH
jgi:hypothetical protein